MINIPGFIIPRSEKEIDRQRKLAEAMMERGMETTPIQSHWQGAARLANALMGGYEGAQANVMEQERQSALAQALKSGSIEQLYASGEPTLIDVARARQQQQRFEAQQAAQEAYRAQQQSNWEAEQAAQAERARATEERLGRTFTPATPEDMQKYGPDYLGKNPQGEPQFRPPTRGPTVKEYEREDGTKGLAQYNESTGKWYDITPVEGQGDGAAAPPPAAAAPAAPGTGNLPLPMPGETGNPPPVAGPAPAPAPVAPARSMPRVPNVPKGVTGEEGKSAFYYRRARNQLKKLTPEMGDIMTSQVQGFGNWAGSKVGMGLGMENKLTSSFYQQAKSRFGQIVAALNRKDSGQAVTEIEWERAFQNWIPMPGQDASIVKQKLQTLAADVAAMKGTSGRMSKVLDAQDQAYDDAYETMAELKKRYGDNIPEAAREMVRQKLRDRGVDPAQEEF